MLLEDSVVVYDAAPDVDVELARANVPAPATVRVEAAQAPPREAPPLRTTKRGILSPDPYADERVTGAGRVKVVVSLPEQKAFVFRGDDLIATSRVSTGKRGHETPVGTFRILQKKVKHHSNLYANAPMPYMQRLTNGGVALHAGHLPGYRASHGCIRLPWSFAKKLYGMTNHGTTVVVTNERIT